MEDRRDEQPRFAEKLSAALRRGKSAPAAGNPAASAKATPAPRSGASVRARAQCSPRSSPAGYSRGTASARRLESAHDVRGARRGLRRPRARSARRGPSFANAGRSGGAGGFTEENPFGADVRAATDTEKKVRGEGRARNAEIADAARHPARRRGVDRGLWKHAARAEGPERRGLHALRYKIQRALLSGGAGEHALYLLLSGGGRHSGGGPATAAAGARGAPTRRAVRRSGARRRSRRSTSRASSRRRKAGRGPCRASWWTRC